jgi:basic amino acid/polyamine antiporter, APA family
LSVRDLTIFGVAAIVGAGIFSTIGVAAYHGGAGVTLLFIITGLSCGFAGVAYAEFASYVPVSGSAYSYTYVAFGELPAWIIGWALIMEYSIGNITYAISFSDYFTGFCRQVFHFDVPASLSTNYTTAKSAFQYAQTHGAIPPQLTSLSEGLTAWQTAPRIGSLPLIADLPALGIIVLVVAIAYRGIRESQRASLIMVILKVSVVLLVIAIGAFYVSPERWQPFLPNGFGGMMRGVSAVFFAYIGFDAISTTSEECKNPQSDIPRAIFYSLAICMTLYIGVALVITGMVSYTELNLGDPLAYVFAQYPQMGWLSNIIGASGLIAITSVLLIYLIGQPRIWMMMSRDGLLPPVFSKIHPRFKTPSVSTLVSGSLVGIPALFLDFSFVTDVSSAATLFAFVAVCGGVFFLYDNPDFQKRRFHAPFMDAKWVLLPAFFVALYFYLKYTPSVIAAEQSPMAVFFTTFLTLIYVSFKKRLPLIPALGLLCCLYIMAQLGWNNWIWLGVWLAMGLFFYFIYGYKNSRLNGEKASVE